MSVTQLLKHLQDPQSWVCLLAASTFIGLGAGAFEPGAPVSTAKAGTVLLAAAEPLAMDAR